jgi:hypothetical protein
VPSVVERVDQIERRLDELDRRESINNEIQNQEFHKVWSAIAHLGRESGPGPGQKLASRKLWVTIIVALIPVLESIRGTVNPELASILTTVIGSLYLIVNTVQKGMMSRASSEGQRPE